MNKYEFHASVDYNPRSGQFEVDCEVRGVRTQDDAVAIAKFLARAFADHLTQNGGSVVQTAATTPSAAPRPSLIVSGT